MRGLLLLSLLSSLCLATTRSELNQSVSWQLDAQQLVSLNAGDKTVLVVQQRFTSARQQGQILIINDVGFNQASRLHQLSTPMANVGWSSFSMAMPRVYQLPDTQEPEQDPQVAADPSPQQADPANPPSVAAYDWQANDSDEIYAWQEALLIEQVQAYFQQLGVHPGYRLIIAEGMAAAWMIKFIAEQRIQVDGLVVIGPYWPQQTFNQQLPDLMASIDIPVLDIQADTLNRWSHLTAATRRIAAQQAFQPHYLQRQISGLYLQTPYTYPWLSKMIIGWSRHHGW